MHFAISTQVHRFFRPLRLSSPHARRGPLPHLAKGSTMDFEALIQDVGYIAITLGTFLEGESTLVFSGFLAHGGYLNFTGVIIAAFIGTLAADQMYFHIGRLKGKAYIENRPRWKAKSESEGEQLIIGDKILVSETSYGIYAYGSVTKVDEIIEFNSVNEILNYTEKNKN